MMSGYRAPGAVQAALHRGGKPARSQAFESAAIFVVAGIAYGILGYWLVTQAQVVSFSSLDRLARAFLIWHNSPPKLAAIGFSYPPLQVLSLLPFTIIKPLATSLVALPVASAIGGGLTLMAVNRALSNCEMEAPLRYALLPLLGLTPLMAFYGANGAPDSWSLFFLAIGLSGLISWFIFVDMRYLFLTALAFGIGVLFDYTLFLYLILGSVMMASVLIRHRASHSEVESSLIALLAPAFYALAVWTLFAAVIVSAPFTWLVSSGGAAVNTSSSTPVHASIGSLAYGTLLLAWDTCPLAFLVIPALLYMGLRQRNELASWLAAFGLLSFLLPLAQALAERNASEIQLSKGLPLILVTVMGGGWLYKSMKANQRTLIGLVLVAGLAIGLPIGWHALSRFPYQNGAQAFARAVSTGQSQEGTISEGGIEVGLANERAMADYIDTHVHSRKSIVTDNAQTYAVILLSGRPQLFVSRVDHGDASWLAQVKHPAHSVHYFLVAQNSSGDLIKSTYPKIGTSSGDPRFPVVFATSRYELLAVGGTAAQDQVTQAASAPSTPSTSAQPSSQTVSPSASVGSPGVPSTSEAATSSGQEGTSTTSEGAATTTSQQEGGQ
jgi:hypothetical protein